MDVQALPKIKCIVPGCSSIDNPQNGVNTLFFFQFPNDANMRKIWKFACTLPDDPSTDAGKICQLHFDPSDYEKLTSWNPQRGVYLFAKLKFYAIPSLNLPRSSVLSTTNSSMVNKIKPHPQTHERNVDETTNLPQIKKCAAAFCDSQSETVFDFPHHENCKVLFSKWLSICNEEVKIMPPETLSELYGICDNHFEKETLILPALLPTLQYSNCVKQDLTEAVKTCRLCLRAGIVDLFSCKYSDKLLKDIIKIFIPIDIKPNDISKLICEVCKSDVIRFYNFLQRSLQVDNYFQMINKSRVRTKNTPAAKPVVPLQEVIMVKSEDEDKEVVTVEDTVIRAESTIVEQPLTTNIINMTMVKRIGDALKSSSAGTSKMSSEQCEYRVPTYVVEHFHNYGKQTKIKAVSERVRKSSKKNQELICIHCNETIENAAAIQDHCKEKDHPPIIICCKCNQMFKSQEELDEHSKIHRKNTGCICEKCGKLFKERVNLSMHLSTVHNKWKFRHECKTCSRRFSTAQTLKEHINRIHKNYKPFCCEHCGATFTTLANLRDHQFTHSNYRPHICLICNKGFYRRNKLKVHLIKHTGERNYSCEKCGIAYKRKLNLRRHNRKYHPGDLPTLEPSRKCSQCDTTFDSIELLKVHMRVHRKKAKNKNLDCKYCDKKFANSTVLDLHMSVHTGKKRYECHVCKKRFTQKAHLQSHLLIHTGEKPYGCKHCSKSFAHRSSLIVHERIHTGETPYVCQVCGKGYGHLTNYKKHALSQHGLTTPKKRDYSGMRIVTEEDNDENVVADSVESSVFNVTEESENNVAVTSISEDMLVVQDEML